MSATSRDFYPTTPWIGSRIPKADGLLPYDRGAGTIIISPPTPSLSGAAGGRALRYASASAATAPVAGTAEHFAQAEWPDWTPPPEMIARQPYLPRFMAAGRVIVGARAMYLGTTVYRIHGTNRPETIGTPSRPLFPAGQCRRRRPL